MVLVVLQEPPITGAFRRSILSMLYDMANVMRSGHKPILSHIVVGTHGKTI